MKYANIVIDISHEKLDRPFQYKIPAELENELEIGQMVEIPFGNGNRIITGYVLEITDKPVFDETKIKSVIGIKKGSLKVTSQLIALAWWIKEYYGSTMNRALKTVIPVKKTVKGIEKKYITLIADEEKAKLLVSYYGRKKTTLARSRLISELINSGTMEQSVITEKLGVSAAVIKALKDKGIIEVTLDRQYRNVAKGISSAEYNIKLNEEQLRVTNEIWGDRTRTHLLFGITGSGKTEVYMELIDRTMKEGKDSIVLIPEIALTYQTIKRFYSRFGDKVSIINSRLSAGERYDQFAKAENGDIRIMIGPRSALFTPFKNLGLIIIDEEHEGAYKSDQVPKYNSRQTAIKRAELAGAMTVFGSATPSVESYYLAKNGQYILHTLENRANGKNLPKVHIVDMREELQHGNRDILSDELKELIKDRLDKKEQIMIFINRRGYSSFVSCRSCGKAVKCPHCDVTLTYHRGNAGKKGRLVCHYCGYNIEMPDRCPVCSSKYLGRFGIGTEQVETKLNELYPDARTVRMDFDTTREKGNYEKILSEFAGREADILIGTQMIVKGHDFPYVTLVGVVAADLSLFSSDYMATERTFELLTQAVGRAGRGTTSGEAVIQTYNPEETCIVNATKQDYESFYNQEISFRSLMAYPPVYSMMAIIVSDSDEKKADRTIDDITNRIEKSNIEGLMVIGPAKASVAKINDIYRYVVYLKHKDMDELVKVKNRIQLYINMVETYKKMIIQFDFTPQNNY